MKNRNKIPIHAPIYIKFDGMVRQGRGGGGTTPSGYGTSTYSCRVKIGRYFRVTELRYQPKNWSNRVTGSDFTAVRGFL